MRTIPSISSFFQPLEDAIHLELLPALTGRPASSSTERNLFSLSCHFGGLGVVNPISICDSQFAASQEITGQLKDLILLNNLFVPTLQTLGPFELGSIKADVRHLRNVLRRLETSSLHSFRELLI